MNALRRHGPRAAGLLLLLVALPACGARGEPLPPSRPAPPKLPGLTVVQRGGTAVLRFDRVPPSLPVTDGSVEVRSVQLLMYAERYAAMTPEILATALQRERDERLQEAREAIEVSERTAAERRARREAAAAAEAAGEEEAPAEEEEAAAEETPAAEEDGEEEEELSDSERLLRGVPDDVLEMWRESGLRGAVILDSARRLDRTVDRLWNEIGLPTAIVQTDRPPQLPDPLEIVETARLVSRQVDYERPMPEPEFLGLAAPVREIPHEELGTGLDEDEEQQEGGALLEYGVGIPASGPIRTRYYFAIRAVSDEDREGALSDIVSLAPAPVPVPPGAPVAEITEDALALTWAPSNGDIWGELLEPDDVGYNVYRRLASEPRFETEPENDEPLEETEFEDEDITWGETYVYEIRALRVSRDDDDEVTAESPGRESAGTVSDEIEAVDLFAPDPPDALEALRTGTRITLRWREPDDDDVAGYRVYRHALPAPELPPDVLPEEEEEEGEAEEEEISGEEASKAGPEEEASPEVVEPETVAGEEIGDEEETEPSEEEAEPSEEEAEPSEKEADAEPGDEPREQEEDTTRQHPDRVRQRVLERLGFELLTEEPTGATRFIDSDTDPAVGYLYLVETLDEGDNVSRTTTVEVPADEEEQSR